MRRPHLLRIEGPAAMFGGLLEALSREDLRVGWLELGAGAPGPPSLEAAAEQGVLRAVAVGGGRTVAVKPMRGEAVLVDLLREHFRGCRLVLVAGELDAPLLSRQAAGWRIEAKGRPAVDFSTVQLVRELRKPKPFATATS